MPETLLFYVLSGLAIGASALVIGQRNPMYSVMLLIASFGALAGLYIQLDAPFVAVAQIIIYAGAIMVLFLFVVMLLNAPQEDAAEWDRTHPLRQPGVSRVRRRCWRCCWSSSSPGRCCGRRSSSSRSAARADAEAVSSVRELGRVLFTDYVFAFEATSILILVAMVGAVVLARREDRLRDSAEPLPDRVGDPVRHRHGRRLPAPQPDHDPAVDRDHAERREPDVRRVRPPRWGASTGRSSCSS